jgi:hypothetical protein
MIEYKIKTWKTLSRNDTGETHSHQSGISIPKEIAKTNIFPQLGIETMNPRVEVIFYDEENNAYTFQYIYYNDIYFREDKKRGHNEYRITCVKDYIKKYSIKSGDKIWFAIDSNNVRRIGFEKSTTDNQAQEQVENKETKEFVLVLKGGWKCIKY